MRVATEEVLVVRREDIFPDGAWHGFVTENLDRHQRVIREKHDFRPRSEVENDPTYQQIIPYVVFRHRDRFFLTHRLRASSERRLRKQYSLGVGGHINRGDLGAGDPILDGLKREWEEEVVYDGKFEARLLGLLNEDSSPVSKVHLGVVFVVDGDSPNIRIRETDKLAGELLTLEEMRMFYLAMESWSQIVYDRLVAEAPPSPSATPPHKWGGP
jgi:predicted NUDIX family phosphoesterase